MSNIQFRTATLEDLPILLEFEQGVIKAERPFSPTLKPDPINYYDIQSFIQDDNIEIKVALWEDTIIGCAYIRLKKSSEFYQNDRHGYIGFMYVKPEFRGRGISRQIIEELISWANTKEVYEIQLEVFADNLPAVKAYEKAGFEKFTVTMRLNSKS